jgi:predicted ATP-dependent endonuclease of OLD family
MLVSEVEIENVKGFEAVSLDFRRPDGSLPHWIVVAGRNGSGKTTFLQSIALAICGPSVARTLRETYANLIRIGAGSGHVSTRLHPIDSDRLENAKRTAASLVTDIGWQTDSSGPEPRIVTRSTDSDGPIAELGPWSPNPQGWFLAG